jgi:hypothetical protein
MDRDFFWDFLPFWIVNYGLAVIAWSCVGRFLLSLMIPPDNPNYILRWFVRLTVWPVRAGAFVTPAFVQPRYVVLLTACWCFGLRFVSFPVFNALGMLPSLQPA